MPANSEKAVYVNRLRRRCTRRPSPDHSNWACRICHTKWFPKRGPDDSLLEMHKADCPVLRLTCEVIDSNELTGLVRPIPIP